MIGMTERRQIDPNALMAARKKAGNGSKTAAAAAAGLTWHGYRLWEKKRGLTNFNWNAFQNLCDYLGVKPEEITIPAPPKPKTDAEDVEASSPQEVAS